LRSAARRLTSEVHHEPSANSVATGPTSRRGGQDDAPGLDGETAKEEVSMNDKPEQSDTDTEHASHSEIEPSRPSRVRVFSHPPYVAPPELQEQWEIHLRPKPDNLSTVDSEDAEETPKK
jgi:hypothetical protein